MRILIATMHRQMIGGIETHLRALLPRLAQAGHELALLYKTAAAPGDAEISDSLPDIPKWCVGDIGHTDLLSQIAAWRPDVLYSHGFHDEFLEEALLDRYPAVFYAHVFDGTCISGTKCQSAIPRPCERVLGRRVC